MKSVFYIIAFFVLAVFFSKPEKSTMKYIPLSFSFSQELNNQNVADLTQVQFIPDSENEQYNIQFNKSLTKKISNHNFNFQFKDCNINRRPQISIECKSKQTSNNGHISTLNLQPLLIFGEEKVNNYLFEVTYLDQKGVSKKLKFLSDSKHLITPDKKDDKDIKVSRLDI